MHLMHVAGNPHQPHRNRPNSNCDQSDPISKIFYFLFADYFPKAEDRPTQEMMQPPIVNAKISQTRLPIARDPICLIQLQLKSIRIWLKAILRSRNKIISKLNANYEPFHKSYKNRNRIKQQSIVFIKSQISYQKNQSNKYRYYSYKYFYSMKQINQFVININNNKMQALQIDSAKNNQKTVQNKSINQQVIFLMHGITCLIGWFVILNSLDYFHAIYYKYDVYEYFLLAILVGYLITAFGYKKITAKFSIRRVVSLGLIVCTVSILLLLVTALIFKNVQGFGFTFSVLICIVVGVSSNAVQLSYFALINFIPEKAISKFTIGTAFSGLILTIIRMIITAFAGTSPHLAPIFIYFMIASIVQIIDLFLNNNFCQSSYFIQKIAPSINKTKQSQKALNLGQQDSTTAAQQEQESFMRQLLKISKKIFPYPLIMIANYVITMMLFPDLTLKIKLGFSQVWSSLIFLFLFALGDTIGKFLVQIKGTFNKKSNFYLIIIRLLFFILIPIMASGKVSDDPLINNPVFPFFVLFLFGLSAGLIVSASVILVSQICEPSQRQLSGVLCGICIQIGLISGIILAFPMQLIAPKQHNI